MEIPSANQASSGRIVMVVVAVALAARLPLLLAGPDVQLSLMADDACYYLEAARRTLETASWPSMDGIHATNGFHPIYFALLLLLQKVIGTDPRHVVPAVFGLNLALNALALVLVVKSLRPRLVGMAGFATAVALAVSPGWLAHGLAGVENSLSSVLLLLAALRWMARFDARGGLGLGAPGPRGGWWLDGVLLGLAMLGRTDAVLFAVLYVGSAFVLRVRSEPWRHVVRDVVVCTGIAALIVAPWVALNFWRFGTIQQDSAAALATRFARQNGAFGTPGWAALFAKNIAFWLYRLGWTWGLLPLTFFLCGYAIPTRRWRKLGSRFASAALVALCIAALAIRANDPWYIDATRSSGIELLLGASAFLLGAVTLRAVASSTWKTHCFLFGWTLILAAVMSGGVGSFQLWYTTAPALAAILVLTVPALATLLRGRPALTAILLCLLVTQSALLVHRYLVRGTTAAGVSPHLIADGDALRQRFETAAASGAFRAGSFDSGQLSYRVHPFPIANLDGVMNHDVARAIVHDDLAGRMRDDHLTHVITGQDRLDSFKQVSAFEAHLDSATSRQLGITVFRLGAP